MIPARTLSITQLYTDHLEKLKLTWIAAVGVERLVVLKDQGIYGPDVVGHLNLIYSHRVQVIGKAEQRWAERVGVERWHRQIDDLMAASPPALIVADGLEIPPGAKDLCEATQTPLFVTPKECSVVIDLLHIYLARRFADTVSAPRKMITLMPTSRHTVQEQCFQGFASSVRSYSALRSFFSPKSSM